MQTPLMRLRLSLRMLVREWRSGELRILLAALVVAIAATTAIHFFTDRLQRGLTQQSAELLGGDSLLISPRPLAADWLAQADHLGLATDHSLEFPSMVRGPAAMRLASVRAISPDYPLRGQLRWRPAPTAIEQDTDQGPVAGTVWVENRVLGLLGVQVGQPLTLGQVTLTITGIVSFEPGRSNGFTSFAPRVLMSIADVAASGVVQQGSRISYQYYFSGGEAALKRFSAWLKPRLDASQQLLDVHSGQPRVGSALERAERYLGLASLAAVLLAGAAIAMAARRYSQHHYDTSAMLRCLGVKQQQIMQLYGLQLLALGVLASALGCVLGWLGQAGLVAVLGDVISVALPPASLQPVVTGFITGVVLLLGFALPPLLRLKAVSPLRVLRRDLAPAPVSSWLVYGAAAVAMLLLLWQATSDWKLVILVFTATVLAILIFALLIYGLLAVVKRLLHQRGGLWRFGINNLLREPRATIVQVMGLGVAITAMAVVASVRTELLVTWQQQLPADTPNIFVVNIAAEQTALFNATLAARSLPPASLYPIARGRLTTINQQPVEQTSSAEGQGAGDRRQTEALHRELNLTWQAALDNPLEQGHDWRAEDVGQARVSVEAGLAERLKLVLGDRVGFDLGGRVLEAEVVSIRSVQWDSFRPNFYFVFPPGVLDAFPQTYMTSIHVPETAKAVLNELVDQLPTITLIDVDMILQQVRTILEQVTLAVEYLLVFVLLAGVIVLFAALQLTFDERQYEGAMLRALGATRRQLTHGYLIEFALLGGLAGLLAACSSQLINALIAHRLFDLPFNWSEQALLLPLLGLAITVMAGYFGLRQVWRRSPMMLLR